MKKNRISRARKRTLNQPDEFVTVSSKVFKFVAEHKIAVVSILGIIVAVGIIIAGTCFFSNQAESKAFALLNKAVMKYKTSLTDKGAAEALKDVTGDFQRILDKYTQRKGGKLTGVVFANICFDAGEFDRSIELYKKAFENFENWPAIKNLALNGLGYAHEAKNEYEIAAGYFEMIASASNPVMKTDAFFNIGRLYDLAGDMDKSRAAYEKIITEYPESMYIDFVREKTAR